MWYGYHKNHDAIIIHFCEKCSRMKIGITFVHAFVYPKILMNMIWGGNKLFEPLANIDICHENNWITSTFDDS